MSYWKKIIISFLLIISTNISAKLQTLDKISAIVNNSIILKSDIDKMLIMIKINIANKKKQINNHSILYKKILYQLIINKIIMQLAKKINIKVSNKEINNIIFNIMLKNNITIKQLKHQLIIYGIDFKYYYNNIRKEIMFIKIRNHEIYHRINIIEQEVNSLANLINLNANKNNDINLSYISIPISKNKTKKQNKLINIKTNKIISQLKHGVNINKLVNNYSNNHYNLKNNQINSIKIKNLPYIFAKQIQYAKKGDIIGPIFYKNIFYILKINNIKYNNTRNITTEVKIRYIFIKSLSTINNKQAYIKIQKIAKQIKNHNITFIEASKKYSQDYYLNLYNKKMKWNKINTFNLTFRNVLVNLKKHEISKPIKSSLGWYIIKLEDIRQIDKTNITQKKDAYNLLFNRKLKEETQIWMQELYASAYIKILN